MPVTRSNSSLSCPQTQPPEERDTRPNLQAPARRTYIALGSNVGDRVRNIEDACRELTTAGIKVRRTSALYETQPMYVVDQDPFINGVCEVGASLQAIFTPPYSNYCILGAGQRRRVHTSRAIAACQINRKAPWKTKDGRKRPPQY